MFCAKCGSELLDHAKFCITCGAKVVEQPVEQTVEQPVIEVVLPQDEIPQLDGMKLMNTAELEAEFGNTTSQEVSTVQVTDAEEVATEVQAANEVQAVNEVQVAVIQPVLKKEKKPWGKQIFNLGTFGVLLTLLLVLIPFFSQIPRGFEWMAVSAVFGAVIYLLFSFCELYSLAYVIAFLLNLYGFCVVMGDIVFYSHDSLFLTVLIIMISAVGCSFMLVHTLNNKRNPLTKQKGGEITLFIVGLLGILLNLVGYILIDLRYLLLFDILGTITISYNWINYFTVFIVILLALLLYCFGQVRTALFFMFCANGELLFGVIEKVATASSVEEIIPCLLILAGLLMLMIGCLNTVRKKDTNKR